MIKLASAVRRRVLCGGLALAALATSAAQALAQDYDVLIRGGTVFDGSLEPRKKADVAIKGDKIVLVGAVPASATAAKVIDATGKYVTPGFIDPHNHSAPLIETEAYAGAKAMLLQGITSILLNPDGGGPGDLKPQLAAIEKWTPGLNVGPTIGHNGVRRDVMGLANRKATADEIAKMSTLVKNAMDQGAFGFSTGPFYIPGKYSDTAELIALSKVAAPYKDSFYISHIRDESSYDIGVVAATKELIDVARAAKIPAVVTHMKAIGPTVWGKTVETNKLIADARAEGLSIWADQYPYAASGSGLQPSLVPGWAQEGGQEAIAKRLQNPEQRALIRKEMVDNMARRGGANSLMIRGYAADPSLDGVRLDELAKRQLKEPVDVAIDMLIKGGAGVISFNMNEDDVERIMKAPWTMTSSDGALVKWGEASEHPRAYGAFPRKFRRYVIERKTLTWEQAVHSSSGLTADVFHFDGRGYLKPGYIADVLVINPETIRDVATYEKPHAYSVGMDYVLVNGKLAVDAGEVTAGRYGKVLRRQR
jgi:N-acyl-D-aspartate/D-glutamate deacylase